MTRRKPLMGLLVVLLTSMIWFITHDKEQDPPEETSQIEACDSCTARHQNLTRLRDARSSSDTGDE